MHLQSQRVGPTDQFRILFNQFLIRANRLGNFGHGLQPFRGQQAPQQRVIRD